MTTQRSDDVTLAPPRRLRDGSVGAKATDHWESGCLGADWARPAIERPSKALFVENRLQELILLFESGHREVERIQADRDDCQKHEDQEAR